MGNGELTEAQREAYYQQEEQRYKEYLAVGGRLSKDEWREKGFPDHPDGDAATPKKVATQIEKKIEKQMSKRGWDKDSVNSTIDNPNRTVSTRDTRWNSDGTRRDDPATAYIREDGHYVVRNNNDGTIVQISNRNQTDWKSSFEWN